MDSSSRSREDEDEIRVLESDEDEEEEAAIIEQDYEDDDEDFKQLDELIPPKVTTWTGANGRIIHGIVVFNDDLYDTNITCQMDACPICFHAWTTHGKHRTCCLPCGHMYGLSCINKWLRQSSSCGKCPQCNTLCSYKDVILLYATRLSGQDKARYFPFTKSAYKLFMVNEQRRQRDARKLIPLTTARVVHILQEMQAVGDQHTISMAQWNDVKKQLEELELPVENFGKPVDDTLEQIDALKRQADSLTLQIEKLEQRLDALEPRACALERRQKALYDRATQYRPRLKFFSQMYKEHQLKIKKTTHLSSAAPTSPKK